MANRLRLLLVRHAESEHNRFRTLSSSPPGLDLSETGRVQAAALARSLAARDVTAVYASPCLRARSTAVAVAEAHRLAVTRSDALLEYGLGELEGATSTEAWRAVEELFAAWMLRDELDAALPGGGESGRSVVDRVRSAVDEAAARTETGGTAVLVGHQGSIRTAVPRIVDNVPPSFGYRHPLRNVDIVEIARAEGGGWTCLRWAGHECFK
jgi:probable phosphoglycerate mutase